ncbi:hypothetical protein CANARDRAFT_140520 [[Candida] arabinofermentans NRRL YB-2248]|uniref:Alcohol acetyltransferase n=1 Tax=[Candida] arabinofermentans NRRL YB-2248 TaxID=983967 RepID=A0A1E4T1V9_9ASCO|nr:hypothetical protein CANARDRAFT_140520 [[Candida] arabinofermentans NRRL YB-2248]
MISRELTFVENFYRIRNEVKCYSNFQVCAEYSSTLSLELVCETLRQLVNKYSQFSQQVVLDEGEYRMKLIDGYTLGDVLEIVEDPTLNMASYLMELNTRMFELGNNKPLWRVILLNKNKLIFYCEHILFDGTSGLNFHTKFKEIANSILTSQPTTLFRGMETVLLETPYSLSLSLKATDIIDYRPSWTVLLKTVIELKLPKKWSKFILSYINGQFAGQLTEGSTYQRPDLNKKEIKFDHLVRILNIPQEKVSQLLAIARSHSVKFTALLYIILHLSLVDILEVSDTKTSIPVNIRSQIDMQKATKLSPAYDPTFGLYMSGITIHAPSLKLLRDSLGKSKKINWEFARQIQSEIESLVPDSRMLIGLISYVDAEQFVKSSVVEPRSQTLEISNLGSIKNPNNEDQIKIVDLLFNQPIGVSGYFECNVAGTDIGGVNLVLSGLAQLSDEFELFCRNAEKWIGFIVD